MGINKDVTYEANHLDEWFILVLVLGFRSVQVQAID